MNTLEPRFEDLPRYIRVRSEPGARFVEFDFAIGYPDLFVELILPQADFDSFCLSNRVVEMDEAMARSVDEDMVKWRFGEVGRRLPGAEG
ncbi:MAG: phenol hydroxylase [Pseudomonas sp. CO183]|jgi:phenol hydroxylase P0 protein|nr:MAG: phenol hydroxylase [Pseudomonas sp. BRH_c35]OCX91329.1 MAG: phenol hydroxylase [Pseudomonas sp. CO183]